MLLSKKIKLEGKTLILPTGGGGRHGPKRFPNIKAALTEMPPELQAMPLYKRTYVCTECGLVRDRDEKSAVNILARYLARLGPHVADAARCADVFTAIDCV